jgi:prepilin-type N-terminal cleavage/methylation domain-containing protein
MLSRQNRGFTLIEMLMVMVIIAVLAGLIMGVSSLAMNKSARSRATGEIKGFETACENFKSDNGGYPRQSGITEGDATGSPSPIDPRKHGDPTSTAYQDSSKFLYQQLTGDEDLNGQMGDNGAKVYLAEIRPSMLTYDKPAASPEKHVTSLTDPFGNSYGYSTAAALDEDIYREKARLKTREGNNNSGITDAVDRESEKHGYNPTFDLWSTGGSKRPIPDEDIRARWIKNW